MAGFRTVSGSEQLGQAMRHASMMYGQASRVPQPVRSWAKPATMPSRIVWSGSAAPCGSGARCEGNSVGSAASSDAIMVPKIEIDVDDGDGSEPVDSDDDDDQVLADSDETTADTDDEFAGVDDSLTSACMLGDVRGDDRSAGLIHGAVHVPAIDKSTSSDAPDAPVHPRRGLAKRGVHAAAVYGPPGDKDCACCHSCGLRINLASLFAKSKSPKPGCPDCYWRTSRQGWLARQEPSEFIKQALVERTKRRRLNHVEAILDVVAGSDGTMQDLRSRLLGQVCLIEQGSSVN